jgi:hypothetical protein
LLWLEARKRKELATSIVPRVAFEFWRNGGRKRLLRIEEKCNDEGRKNVVGRVKTMKRQKLRKKGAKDVYQKETMKKGNYG